MADKKGSLVRKLAIAAGLLVAVLVVAYFVVTSGAFIKAVVLPRVASSLNSDLAVDEVSLSPFSGLDLRGVKLTPNGEAPLATIESVRIRYSLASLLSGSPDIGEITIDKPVITVIERADKSGNLAKALSGTAKPAESAPGPSGGPLKFRVQNIKINQLTFRQTSEAKSGTNVIEIVVSSLAVDQAGNGLATKVSLALGASVKKGADTLAATLQGAFGVQLDANLLPQSATGGLEMSVGQATGAFAKAAGLGAKLSLDVTASEVKSLQLAFSRSGADAGRLTLAGPFDLAKKESRVNYEISGIGREVMGLVGGAVGLDLGTTTVGLKGKADLAQQGSLIGAAGKLTISNFSVVTTNGPTPKLDIDLSYKATFNQTDKTLLLEDLTLTAKNGGAVIVSGQFDRPMNLALGQSQPGFREATYTLSVKGLKLGAWRPFAGPLLPDGSLTTEIKVIGERDGRRLQMQTTTQLDDVAGSVAGVAFKEMGVSLAAKAALEDFSIAHLESLDGAVTHAGRPLLKVSVVANYSGVSGDVGAQGTVQLKLREALVVYPVAGVSFDQGDAAVSVQVSQARDAQDAAVTLSLQNLSGSVAGIALSRYQAKIDTIVKRVRDTATLDRFQVQLQNGFAEGGSVDLSGRMDLSKKSGTFEMHVTDLNEKGLGPFLAKSFGENHLASGKLRANGSGSFDLAGESSAKLELKFADVQLDGPGGKIPSKPVSLGASLDVAGKGMRFDLKSAQFDLGATPKAKNLLNVAGVVDLSTNAPAPTKITVSSDGLDLTPLYALATAGKSGATNAAPPAKPAASGPAGEPPAVTLPLQQAELVLDLKRLFLGNVAITNWTGDVRLSNGAVTIDPFQLTLNGAPVSAKVNARLDKPGYQYDLSFSAKSVPLEPLIVTFATNFAGQIGGSATAVASIQGAGVTPPSLAKNLNGTLQADASGMNFKLSSVKSGLLKTIVNLIVGLPDLISAPQNFINTVFAPGGSTKAGGWVDQLQAAPIQTVALAADIQSGQVRVSKAMARSDAIQVNVPGTVTLAPIMTNSPIQFTVDLGLKPALAKRIGLDGAGDYVALPKDFVLIGGTLGAPKPAPDYSKLALLAGKGILGVAGNTAAAVGGLVGVGNGTNASAAGKLINGIGNLFGGGAGATNAPASTNKASLNPLDLLKGFGK